MNNLALYGFVALGGATGAVLRTFIAQTATAVLGKGFPYGTLIVNIIGSLLMGVLFALLDDNIIAETPWRQLIGLGFLGALTTFSTFSMDSLLLLQDGNWLKAGLNVSLNVFVCIFVAYLGMRLVFRA
ncbi:fluoride efflux transporter CrcB [Moritella viscosa]|uniref:Fluoride-specific ion channel FluC n=1 Tax=Moritella viscosa TaxID=80854 RepID=A0A090IGB7_9GAMM|nr:fluoride efflux transporter CrcB [Moritella viscosa]CED61276.1 CrcB-like protein [Moritella viscosa]SGY88290.1 Protein CrcB homolog [Moritella viscosa]SGY91574.1 Protein CrcB homolog [Moritella viscosa]SGY91649.1 Protein CrcB homolog [Moritella viscosa]SGY95190.1 Protein CrcB homolog [Moritella viscosa]